MKKALFSLSLLLGITATNAQTLISESFEGTTFPPTGWTKTNTNASRTWDLTANVFPGTTAPSPELKARFTLAGNNSATIDWVAGANTANLVSPAFSLAGTTNPVLKFKVKVGWSYMISSNAGNLLTQISTDGGTIWTTLWNEDAEPGFTDDNDGNTETDLYNTVNVQKSLTAYIGQANVKIRFQYVATNADAVSVDDVQVLASPSLSTQEAASKSKESVALYPNPTKGEINIKTDQKIKSTTVFDMTGKSLLQNDTEKADISSLPKGTYLVKISFADGSTSTRKVIKQ
ncbi:T9SS type A sorting domain-containing protein [Chryseobacterium herbae]|uniref:T9SS type A sorting domain-containing protein n=1 Tax=Chryseobacterium herbae TaxID=2976476 RepID=A0ABT2IWV3_9FLAO|nr:T9SS type A sorting domain-containing protein [Chryseobacterium sp. pc1-10]MCT2563326.1 T9SS type A sorting domain-containing protein [Chryseobacterium sp. pc1-10]